MCSPDLLAPWGKDLFLFYSWKPESQGGDPKSHEGRWWARQCPICLSTGLLVELVQVQGAFPCFEDITNSILIWASVSQPCSLSLLILQAFRACLWCERTLFPPGL